MGFLREKCSHDFGLPYWKINVKFLVNFMFKFSFFLDYFLFLFLDNVTKQKKMNDGL